MQHNEGTWDPWQLFDCIDLLVILDSQICKTTALRCIFCFCSFSILLLDILFVDSMKSLMSIFDFLYACFRFHSRILLSKHWKMFRIVTFGNTPMYHSFRSEVFVTKSTVVSDFRSKGEYLVTFPFINKSEVQYENKGVASATAPTCCYLSQQLSLLW